MRLARVAARSWYARFARVREGGHIRELDGIFTYLNIGAVRHLRSAVFRY
jgi:predicted alpha/beta hydrolase family esterase